MSDRTPRPWRVERVTDWGGTYWFARRGELLMGSFPTHAEAITYADRQARTVEVYDQARRIINDWITRHTGMTPMQRAVQAWARAQDALATIAEALTPLTDTLTKENTND